MNNLGESLGFFNALKFKGEAKFLRKTSKKSVKAHKKAEKFGKSIILANSLKSKWWKFAVMTLVRLEMIKAFELISQIKPTANKKAIIC